MKILLIEDDLDAAHHLRALLEDTWDATVTIAHCGEKARHALDENRVAGGATAPFDLVMLDIGLPDIDGIELCRQVRREGDLKSMPIVVVSAFSDEEHIEQAFDAGASDYVTKPVRPRELLARIRSAMREQRDRLQLSAATDRLQGVVEEVQRSNRALQRLATVDPVTQLPNRRQFNIVFHREWRRASRSNGGIAVVMIDIDHFHAFNETYGHLAGDDCLTQVANALTGLERRSCDEVARWGGEEFVYVLPDCDRAGAYRVGERIRAAVEALAIPHASSSASDRVTVSVGAAAMKPRPDLSPETLLAAADDALFHAKRSGRNQVCEAPDAAPGHVVQVDPLIAARVPKFLANRRDDARALVDAARDSKLDVAFRIGHNLKGIGASYGFDKISEIGARVEVAAKASDLDELRRAALDLASYIDQVKTVVRAAEPVANGGVGRVAASTPR